MTSKSAQIWWGFLGLLLVVAVWTTCTGYTLLYGFPLEVLEALAQGRGLLLNESPPAITLVTLLGKLPGDSMAWAGLFSAGANCVAAVALLLVTGWAWKNPISPVLAVGVAFFGAHTMWVKSLSPHDSLLHLLLALCLSALVAGAVPLLAGLVLSTAVLAPDQALMMYLALAYLCYRRQPAYGLAVPTGALFGVGCLLIPLSGSYRLHPGLGGWGLVSLLPLALALWPSSVRQARGGIYLSLLAGSALTGTGEVASVLATGDLAFVALAGCAAAAAAPNPLPPGQKIEGRPLVGLAATAALVALVLPGERFLNREVLIPSHRAGVPLPKLLTVFSLTEHAKRFAEEPWRVNVPFPQLTASDCEVALDLSGRELPKAFCPLTLGQFQEDRELALVYALICNRQLGGWDSREHLAGPLLLCKLRGKSFLHDGPLLVLRQAGVAEVAEPVALPATAAPLDLRSILGLAYRPQIVSDRAGAAYRWTSAGQTYELSFLEEKAEVLLSDRPGEYRVTSLAPSAATRLLEIPPLDWQVSELTGSRPLPSRSLVPVVVRLKNLGSGPLSSDLVSSWRFAVKGFDPEAAFAQKSGSSFILYPGESVLLTLQLATPEGEGKFDLELSAVTPEGKELRLPIEGPSQIQTWRRLPPVGTWVEEP